MDVQRIATEEDCTSRGRSYAFCRLVATLTFLPFLTFLRPTVRIPRVVHRAQQWPEDIPQKRPSYLEATGKVPSFKRLWNPPPSTPLRQALVEEPTRF